MRPICIVSCILLPLNFLVSLQVKSADVSFSQPAAESDARIFSAKGIVEAIQLNNATAVIRHEAISNFMDAMTMPFQVKDKSELARLRPGDEISFQLYVTKTESWVGQITKIGTSPLPMQKSESLKTTVAPENPLLNYKFTNELGQAISLNDFHGQALAITFFYTRCPLPNYCPRLSKNFQEASQKLAAMTNLPANWHFISISFDPEFDTPQTLKAYGESYGYNPQHWTFLTGPSDKIGELARACGVSYTRDGATINHDFRTLIVNPAGHLQMVFPMTGDFSDQIVSEIIKAVTATNSMESNH